MQRIFYGLFESNENRSDYVFDTIKEANRQKNVYEKHGHGPFRIKEVSQSGRKLQDKEPVKITESKRPLKRVREFLDDSNHEAKAWFKRHKSEFIEEYFKNEDDSYNVCEDIAQGLIARGVDEETAYSMANDFMDEVEVTDMGFNEEDFDRPIEDESLIEAKRVLKKAGFKIEESKPKSKKRIREMLCTSNEDSRTFNEKYPNGIGDTSKIIPDFIHNLKFREAKKLLAKAGYKVIRG